MGATGIIAGRVSVLHPPIAPAAPAVVPQGCAHPWTPDQLVLGENGALADALVTLKGDLPRWKPDAPLPFVLDQAGCHYSPHVLAVPVDFPVTFKNSDTVLHNVKIAAVLNPSANFGVPAGGSSDLTFHKAEVMNIGCSVHPFMAGCVAVLENRCFAVTAGDGTFQIEGVPPGTYTLFVTHPLLGKAVKGGQKIVVTPAARTTVDVAFD